ncbi:MAG: M23 family metallopeptidase [Candidatus Aminicenantes bacterium]|nr:MAG: M23 family metallopeptidase [Candidatus Aminicenantes bacterium]
MAKKYLSLIVCPHYRGKHRTLTLSKKALRTVVSLTVFVFFLLGVFLVDYFTVNVTRQKYRELLEENIRYKDKIAQQKESIKEFKDTIEYFENYAKKLNVMAGLKSPEVLKEVGLGGGSQNNSQQMNPIESSQSFTLKDIKRISEKAEGIERNLSQLVVFFENEKAILASTPTIWPTKGYLASHFGWRDDPFTGKRAFHRGYDIVTHFGNPVVATADGVIIRCREDKIGGKSVVISHRGGYTTRYLHLSKWLVKPGQKVKRGDTIGLVGSTGKSRGPHVHYEVHVNGRPVNPYRYILEE